MNKICNDFDLCVAFFPKLISTKIGFWIDLTAAHANKFQTVYFRYSLILFIWYVWVTLHCLCFLIGWLKHQQQESMKMHPPSLKKYLWKCLYNGKTFLEVTVNEHMIDQGKKCVEDCMKLSGTAYVSTVEVCKCCSAVLKYYSLNNIWCTARGERPCSQIHQCCENIPGAAQIVKNSRQEGQEAACCPS